MVRYLVTRAVWLFCVLVACSVLTFAVFNVLPARNDVGFGFASQGPVMVHLGHYLDRAFLHFDLGHAWDAPRAPVAQMLRQALPATISLMGGALAVAVALGIPLGMRCAERPHSLQARAITALAVLALTAPVYWLGLMMLRVFEPSIGVIPLPFIGHSGSYEPLTHNPWHWFKSLLLPWLALGLPLAGLIVRMLNTSMRETLDED